MVESDRAPFVAPERKRDHAEVGLNETVHVTFGNTPESKRPKFNETEQECRNSPAHNQNKANAAAQSCMGGQDSNRHNEKGGEGAGDGQAQTGDRSKKNAGATPSINWNAGSKANIRISFGRGSLRSSKNEGIRNVTAGKTSEASQLEEQQVDPKAANSISSDRSSSSQQLRSLEHEKFDQVPNICVNDTVPRASANDDGGLELTATESGREEHVKSSLTEPILIDDDATDDATARKQIFIDEKSKYGQLHSDVDSEGRVILSLETSDDESGEISETEVRTSDRRETAKVPAGLDPAEANLTRSESTDDDAMMVYSNSNPVFDATAHGHPLSARVDVQRRLPRLLSDLKPDELKLQLKYFYITRSPDRVDPSDPVRCLVCAQKGHMAEVCNTLTCAVCGKYDEHSTTDCAQVKRCWKCRERGHLGSQCSRTVRPANGLPLICDLCQRSGHIEDECELIWRTSGRPWESDLRNRSIRLGCYECGRSGHLGNDCPTRKPGKRPGTSSWSLNGARRLSTESERGITIKGRATQQKAIVLDDSEDDAADFFRPKVPQPTRRGQIRVAAQSFGRHRTEIAPGVSSKRQESRDATFSNRRDKEEYNPRSNERRSISPRYSEQSSYRNSSVNQPPLPREEPPERAGRNISYQSTRSKRAGESYRPMPSAARDAWIRHRT